MAIENHYEDHFRHSHIYLDEAERWVEKLVEQGKVPAEAVYDFYEEIISSLGYLQREARREAALLSVRTHAAMCELLKRTRGVPYRELIPTREFTLLINVGSHLAHPGDANYNEEQRKAWVNASAVVCYSLASFENAGRRSYEVSAGLAEKLLHTELRGLHSEDLRLPYEAVYIQIPRRLEFFIEGSKRGRDILTGAYITEEEVGEERKWYFTATARSSTVEILDSMEFQNHGLLSFDVHLKKGRLLDDVILELSKIRPGVDYHGKIDPSGSHSSLGDFFRWCMNAMLYATWPDAEVENAVTNKQARDLWKRIKKLKKGTKKRGLLNKVKSMNPRSRIILGRSITVDRTSDRGQGTGEKTGQLRVRTRVSGHWRNQPYGPRHSLRRRQWIVPFWRGPEDGPLGPTKHLLTVSKEA